MSLKHVLLQFTVSHRPLEVQGMRIPTRYYQSFRYGVSPGLQPVTL